MAQPGGVAIPGIKLQGKRQKGLALAPAEAVSRLPKNKKGELPIDWVLSGNASEEVISVLESHSFVPSKVRETISDFSVDSSLHASSDVSDRMPLMVAIQNPEASSKETEA
jgi:hypothetical protein